MKVQTFFLVYNQEIYFPCLENESPGGELWLIDDYHQDTMGSLGKIFPKIPNEYIFSGIWQFLILMALKDIKKTK